MPELLIELFSEEIPARMQAKAAEDLRALITNGLMEAGLTYEGAQAHAGPRRLVLSVEGLNAQAKEIKEDRKGPSVDAPQSAIDGFLKTTGKKLEELEIHDLKKGKTYVAVMRRPGRAATDIIAELVPQTIRKFPWPKSMRWGAGTLRWVRPLQSILCTFDGELVPFEIEGIKSGNTTRGHRFMGLAKIEARRFEDYAQKLHKEFVIVDAGARAETIRAEARNLAFAQGLELIEDEGLLKEAAGLVEWPVVLMGEFDKKFLEVPPEVIATSLKNHQKCFALREVKTAKLANKYLLVANLIASDGGRQIVAGNNKVIAARLSDAKFFWDQDRKTPLRDLLPKLDTITFHAKLGSQGERVARIEALAGEIAKTIGADVEKSKLAAKLAKADLVTGMVGEFPELQGLMGRYYALDQGIDPETADAIRDHYKPQGPSDSIPVSKVGQAVALADKLDTLVGFWAIDEKPTGSKDPYALRRAALGVIRMILEDNNRIQLLEVMQYQFDELMHSGLAELYISREIRRLLANEKYDFDVLVTSLTPVHRHFFQRAAGISFWKVGSNYQFDCDVRAWFITALNELLQLHIRETLPFLKGTLSPEHWERATGVAERISDELLADLLAFFADRLKVHLRDQGARHDLIDAVFALGNQDDLLMIVRRVEALSKFLETDDGKNLLAGVKRASNILKIEEKKDGRSYADDPRVDQLIKGEEKALHTAITIATGQARKAVNEEDFEAAMRAIAKLRGPVDSFFDHVTVNDKDATFRENRLRLLNRIRAATQEVADFSRIEG